MRLGNEHGKSEQKMHSCKATAQGGVNLNKRCAKASNTANVGCMRRQEADLRCEQPDQRPLKHMAVQTVDTTTSSETNSLIRMLRSA